MRAFDILTMYVKSSQYKMRAKRSRGSVGFEFQPTGRCKFQIIRAHRVSTDGLIIAASIPTRYHRPRHVIAASSTRFRLSRPYLSQETKRHTYLSRECTCAYYTTGISCDPRTFEQWRIASAGGSHE